MTQEQLEARQVLIYLCTVVAAVAYGVLDSANAQFVEVLVTPAIAVLMYAMFLQMPFLTMGAGMIDRRFMSALLLANFVGVPLLVWALTGQLVNQPGLLFGALLVLLTPCIDYVVVFTHLGKGDARLTLSATPLLLLTQLLLLPVYLAAILGGSAEVDLAIGPFLLAFLLLIVLPLGLAVMTSAGAKRFSAVAAWNNAWAWMPVPAMALVLFVVIAPQINVVLRDFSQLLPVVPVYLAFAVLAPAIGWATARLMRLPVAQQRSVMFSASTRNSLVVLPLALALPEQLRTLAAAAVITQTLVELVCELIYVRAFPRLART